MSTVKSGDESVLKGGISKTFRRMLLGSVAVSFATPFTAPAFAQDDAETLDLTAVTVIARKSEESLQDVPIAITAVTAETIDTYQFNEIADVVGRVPGLNVQVGGSGAGGQIFLRGVGTTNISAAFDSAVAFDFDGVQLSTQRLVQAAFFDVEQIEVLKGPQSLFFGKSATAGVFSLRSANPTDTWEVSGKTSYEFEEEGYTVEGVVSGPLTETLGVRVAAHFQDIEKFLELDAGTPSTYDAKGVRNFVARGTLQWDPSETFSANLKLNYNHNDSDTLLGHQDVACGPNGVAEDTFLLGGGIRIAPTASCNIEDEFFPHPDAHPALGVILPGTTGASRFDGRSYNETETFFARLNMDWDVSEDFTVSSVTGYVDLQNEHLDNFNYTGILDDGSPGGLAAPFSDGLEQFTQELRIASNFDGRFNFMLGAFYEDRNIPLTTSQNAVVIALVAPDPITGSTYDWYSERTTETEAVSLFGSASFDITDRLNLSGGLRWTEEEKVATIAFPYVHAFLGGGGTFIPSGFESNPIIFEDDDLSPEIVLTYELNDDINIYGAYKEGFKSGGIDNSALPTNSLLGLIDPDPAVVAAAEQSLLFESETAQGGEIGIKSQFPELGLTINASLFHFVFENLQVQNFDGQAIQFFTENAGELTTQGLDVDWSWVTPIDGLSMSGAILLNDASFSDTFIARSSGEDLNGREASRAPDVSGNIAFDYTRPIGSSFVGGVNTNFFYSADYIPNQDTITPPVQDSYVTIDAGVFFGDADGKWRFSLNASNLTDEIWVNVQGNTGARPFQEPGVGDDSIASVNRGRQIFATLQFAL